MMKAQTQINNIHVKENVSSNISHSEIKAVVSHVKNEPNKETGMVGRISYLLRQGTLFLF